MIDKDISQISPGSCKASTVAAVDLATGADAHLTGDLKKSGSFWSKAVENGWQVSRSIRIYIPAKTKVSTNTPPVGTSSGPWLDGIVGIGGQDSAILALFQKLKSSGDFDLDIVVDLGPTLSHSSNEGGAPYDPASYL